MVMPNFLIIGAAKAGTTSLYHYLNQHPQIYMSPIKEPNFFALEGEKPNFRGPGDAQVINRYSITELECYQTHFKGITRETHVGEASTLYLYHPHAAERIRYYTPNTKLIAILRDPVDRAFSNFLHAIRDGREPLMDFAEALRAEDARISGHWGPLWHYKQRGFYYSQLKRYFDKFEGKQIKVYLYTDLKPNPLSVVKDMLQFLEIDEPFTPDVSLKLNVTGVPKNKLLHYAFVKLNPFKAFIEPLIPAKLHLQLNKLKNNNLAKKSLSREVRRELVKEYRDDILKLQELIQRDLSPWLSPERS